MSSIRTSRAFAIAAAVVVALAGMLPFAHVHADDDHPVVHRHVIAGDHGHHDQVLSGEAIAAGHTAHSDATFLTPSYERAREFAAVGDPADARWLVTPPASSVLAPAGRRTMLPTHDPPLRFVSSPAPPAAV